MIRLAALDAKDLEVISALVQDAVLKAADISRSKSGTFALEMNRFAWDHAPRKFLGRSLPTTNERRRAVLHFARVTAAQVSGISKSTPDEILSLLAVRFITAEAPAGTIELTFSGGATIRLSVECIECQLTDLGAAWAAVATPKHSL
ncbi:MAG: DUF2948 family protein [Notoacmeibacter sp.]